MASIILLGNNGSAESLASALRATQGQIVTVVADSVDATIGAALVLNSQGRKASSIMTEIARSSIEKTILFIDTRAVVSKESIDTILAEVNSNSSAAISITPIETASETVELSEGTLESAIKTLTSGSVWPKLCVAMTKEMALRSASLQSETLPEMLMMATIAALTDHETIASTTQTLNADIEACRLSSSETARGLKLLVNSSNIEELFPAHNWTTFQEESAAAAYHSLAAIFIRLGDTESAQQCLNLSDQFEDSPRSLALKGLIAQQKGETLGAVANMVSSLQAYESRKKDERAHYLSFAPKDLESINKRLNDGLQALNRRDNETALNFFAEAVFDFDPFYSEFGVNRVK